MDDNTGNLPIGSTYVYVYATQRDDLPFAVAGGIVGESPLALAMFRDFDTAEIFADDCEVDSVLILPSAQSARDRIRWNASAEGIARATGSVAARYSVTRRTADGALEVIAENTWTRPND